MRNKKLLSFATKFSSAIEKLSTYDDGEFKSLYEEGDANDPLIEEFERIIKNTPCKDYIVDNNIYPDKSNPGSMLATVELAIESNNEKSPTISKEQLDKYMHHLSKEFKNAFPNSINSIHKSEFEPDQSSYARELRVFIPNVVVENPKESGIFPKAPYRK